MLNTNPVTLQKEFTQEVAIDGVQVTLSLSHHALERIEDHNLSQWEVLADVMLAGDKILDVGPSMEVAIFNMDSQITTIVSPSAEAGIHFDVITVMNHIPVHTAKNGKKVVRLSNVARIITLNGHY